MYSLCYFALIFITVHYVKHRLTEDKSLLLIYEHTGIGLSKQGIS